jgi:xylan 1,4-beta-xylosidase
MYQHITVFPDRPIGSIPNSPQFCVGSGRAVLALKSEYREQLAYAVEHGGFRRVRFHGIFNDEMEIVSPRGEVECQFDFKKVFTVVDHLLDIGVEPFIELSFMPSLLASGEKTIFWWKGNVTPPKILSLWGELVYGLVKGLVERYGKPRVSGWYFEVWNEPDLPNFWAGTREEYFELYRESAKRVREVLPDARIGGPATAEMRWLREFAAFVSQEELPADFVSTHVYGVKGALDVNGKRVLVLESDLDIVAKNMIETRELVSELLGEETELHFTEWSSSYSSRDLVHDSMFQAGYVLNTIKRAWRTVDSLSYWTFSDIFEELGPPPEGLHGGFGLLDQYGKEKPVFSAYRCLNRLCGEEVETDSDQVIAAFHGTTLQLLCWSMRHPGPGRPNREVFGGTYEEKEGEEVLWNVHVPGFFLKAARCFGFGERVISLNLSSDQKGGAISFVGEENDVRYLELEIEQM